MPTMNNYLNLIYVNLGFIAQITVMMYFKSALEIKENWPIYRCNPPYWVFSEKLISRLMNLLMLSETYSKALIF